MPQPDTLLRGPFTRRTARDAGITDRRLSGPRFVRLHVGVYVAAGTRLTTAVRAGAALLAVGDGAVVARHTAAGLWGGVVPEPKHRDTVHLVVAPGQHVRTAGIDARQRSQINSVRLEGLPVTSPVQTFCDLAEDLDLVELVVLGDSLVHRRRTTTQDLIQAASGFTGPGAALARRAASYVRAGVDSPMETRVRMLLVLAGLPEPAVNVILRHADGHWEFRLDLAYPQWRIAIEYDGRQHAESTTQWVRDVGRRETLDTRGWRLVVVLSGDVYNVPDALLDRVVAVVRERGGSVRVTSKEWRRYFPGRTMPASW